MEMAQRYLLTTLYHCDIIQVKFTQLKKAMSELGSAYKRRQQALTDHVIYAGIAKCFEVSLEYA